MAEKYLAVGWMELRHDDVVAFELRGRDLSSSSRTAEHVLDDAISADL
jgi:hypothetical protein